MNLADGYAALMAAAAQAWTLPVKLSVSDWADAYRIVPSKSSPEGGKWRTSRTPYAAEPMNELSSMSRTQEVVIMAASQVLKTEVLLNFVFESIDQDPCAMLVVQPTEKAVSDFVSQRLDPAIDAMDRIKVLIPSARKRDSGNKRTEKNFPGGALYLGWSNSPSELASKPIKKLALDEVDRYPVSLRDEGSPVKLAEQRTANYPRRKILKTSTPKIKGASVIEEEYESSSQGQYFVPCPHCNHYQVLVFGQLRWKETIDDDGVVHQWPDTTTYLCIDCEEPIEERFKPQMLAAGEWRHRYAQRVKRGYHISGYYSPVGLGFSWGERVQKWIDTGGDPAKLQTFVNLHDGLPYEDHSAELETTDLKDRAEGFALRTLLPNYVLLTLGVDVQKGYFAFHLVAWRHGERCHTVDYTEIPADPSRSEEWEKITEYRRRPIRNSFGMDVRVAMTAIDSGNGQDGHTNEAYKYARKYRHDDVMVIKGHSQSNRPVLGRPKRQDIKNEKGDVDRNGVDLWMVGTDTAKGAFFSRIDGDRQHCQPDDWMVRFSKALPDTFFTGVVSEYFDHDTGKYEKRHKRNEPLDTWVYAYAAAHHPRVSIHTASAADWDELERKVQPRVHDMFAMPAAVVAEVEAEASAEVVQTTAPAPEPREEVTTEAEQSRDREEHDNWVPDVPDNWY